MAYEWSIASIPGFSANLNIQMSKPLPDDNTMSLNISFSVENGNDNVVLAAANSIIDGLTGDGWSYVSSNRSGAATQSIDPE